MPTTFTLLKKAWVIESSESLTQFTLIMPNAFGIASRHTSITAGFELAA